MARPSEPVGVCCASLTGGCTSSPFVAMLSTSAFKICHHFSSVQSVVWIVDASHFVNSLWLLSQSRAFHYRYAEIKEGGYLADHVQQPILVPYPGDWPEDVTFQQLISNWANQGPGQYLMDDKKVLICHVTRNTCIDGIMTKHSKPFNPYGTFTMPRSLDGFGSHSLGR